MSKFEKDALLRLLDEIEAKNGLTKEECDGIREVISA
jgi:hypothetical protein